MQRLHKGLVSPKDLAWHEGLAQWATVEEVFEKHLHTHTAASPLVAMVRTSPKPRAFSSSTAAPDEGATVTSLGNKAETPVSTPANSTMGYRWGRFVGGALVAGYRWGYFLGGSLVVLGAFFIVASVVALFTKPADFLPMILGGVFCALWGAFIIKRNRWALGFGAAFISYGIWPGPLGLSSLSPLYVPCLLVAFLVSLANFIYVKRRWKEMGSKTT